MRPRLNRQGCDRDYKPYKERAHAAEHQKIIERVAQFARRKSRASDQCQIVRPLHGRPSVDEARCYRDEKVAALQRFAGEGVKQPLRRAVRMGSAVLWSNGNELTHLTQFR